MVFITTPKQINSVFGEFSFDNDILVGDFQVAVAIIQYAWYRAQNRC